MNEQSHVPDHCSVFALSDKSDADLRKQCDHTHDEVCNQCHALTVALKDIEEAVRTAAFDLREDQEESLYLCQSAMNAIEAWKSHQMRTVRQDQARIDTFELLNEESILVVSDWAMKFLPQMYRESQQNWYGKRGISWYNSVVFCRNDDVLQSQAFVHIIQSCAQDSQSVVLIMRHMLQTLKTEHPEIVQACFCQDNAGCYHCSNTVAALAYMEKEVGIKVAHVDFSDPQGGKGAADRLAATCKCHIRIYINEGHNVSTAEEMKEALLSQGGIPGVRFAIVQSFDNSLVVEQQKIPGITKLNNFTCTKGGLLAHRSYSIGRGKCIILQDQSGKL